MTAIPGEQHPLETTLVLRPGHTYATVTDKISDLVLTRPSSSTR